MKDTPEQARLRKAVEAAKKWPWDSCDPVGMAAIDLVAAAEAVLPKREQWAYLGECDVTRYGTLRLGDGVVATINTFHGMTAAQRIRAAVLLKHSKRLMDRIFNGEYSEVCFEAREINAEADQLITETGV